VLPPMPVLRTRRYWPHSLGALSACATACLLCACSEGVVQPLILASLDGGDAATVSVTAGRSSQRADGGGETDVDEPATSELTSECQLVNGSTWPTEYAADATKLVQQINTLRTTTTGVCGPTFGPFFALEQDPTFMCAARLRLPDRSAQRNPNSPPSATQWIDREQKTEANDPRDRGKRAGVKDNGAKIVSEIIFFNFTTVEEILDAVEDDPGVSQKFCSTALFPLLTLVGAARYGNVWVLDFGSPTGGTGRPPGPSQH
jgi:hypothetical protein